MAQHAATGLNVEVRYDRTPHLVDLVGHAERLAALLPGDRDEPALDRAALASVRLDGSRLEEVPDLAPLAEPATRVDHLESWEREPEEGAEESLWIDPLGYVHRTDAQITALEFVGARSVLDADDLAGTILTDPVVALRELHRRLTRGLVDEDRAGEPRITTQVVHDSSSGRILFYPVDAAQIPGRLAGLAAWLVSDGAREHALIASGVLHHELLAVHPFEAANGRLARIASRLVLRSRGLDPGGRLGVEEALDRDPLGYIEEVARTTRRRDLTIWLERWGEAVVDGLRRSARSAGVLDVDLPDGAVAFVERPGPDRFTVADYREAVAADTETARAHLGALLDAGRVLLVPGSRGLRYSKVQ